MTINLSQHAGGGNYEVYDPGMMTLDGSTGYYSITTTTAGTAVIAVIRFNVASFTGGSTGKLFRANGASTYERIGIALFPGDHATPAAQDKVRVYTQNGSGTLLFDSYSLVTVCDGMDHVLFYSYDGSAGTSVFYIDGVDAKDPSGPSYTAATTGTPASAAGSQITIGANTGGVSGFVAGDIGYCGYAESYLTNPTDFYHPTNGLQQIDESGWTEWGAQPLFWNASGFMEDNKGSAGDMTKNGVIDLTSPSTIIIPAGLGLPTIGDAVAADISSGKIAWVDGVRLVGALPAYSTKTLLFFDAMNLPVGAIGSLTPQYAASGIGLVPANLSMYSSGISSTTDDTASLYITGLPAKTGRRRIVYTAHLDNSGPVNNILDLRFNITDSSNYWTARIADNGTTWAVSLLEDGVTSRGTDNPLSTIQDATVLVTLEDYGDEVSMAIAWAEDGTENVATDVTYITYYAITRPEQNSVNATLYWLLPGSGLLTLQSLLVQDF